MKKLTIILVIAAFAAFAPKAMAQAGPLSLGGMIGLDEKRLEVAPSVSFGMAIYTCQPPSEGFEGTGLTGMFSSALGQYPSGNKNLWVKAQVDPFGIRTLKGISRALVNNPQLDRKEDWEPIVRESDGTYTDVRCLTKVGVIPFVYRLEHRDGRDRYQFLFITATWTRGGNLPAKLEMMVRPEIPGFASMQAKDILTYTNGFVPAFGPLQAPPQQPQQITAPGQSVTTTADPTQVNTNTNGNFPTLSPPTGGQQRREEQFTPFGVTFSGRQFLTAKDKESAWNARELTPFTDSLKAAQDGFVIPIDPSIASFICRMESAKAFKVMLKHSTGEQAMDIVRTNTGYVCVIYGSSSNFLNKEIELVVTQDGQTRTIKFTRNNS